LEEECRSCNGHGSFLSPSNLARSFSDIIEAIERAAASQAYQSQPEVPMKHFSHLFVLLCFSAVALTGCEEIGDILKSDVWTGVLLVFLVIGIIVCWFTSSKI
jgi:hypothetical protein